MKITKKRVAIVGCGLVGATTAFSLETQGVCDEIMMIDINGERALGEMLDLKDAIEYLGRNVKLTTGSYEDVMAGCEGLLKYILENFPNPEKP